MLDAFNAAREAVKDKATEEVFNSIRIADLDAEAFEKRADRSSEEQAQLDKHTTLDRWGRDDRDLAEDTVVGRGRRWRQARSLVFGAAILLGLRGRVREPEKRRIEVEGKDGKQYAYQSQAAHDEARANEIVEILRLANIDLDRISSNYLYVNPPKTGCEWDSGSLTNLTVNMLGWDDAGTTNDSRGQEVDFSEIYVDTTRARVELSEQSTWSVAAPGTTIKREVQGLLLSWSDTEIRVQLNQGAFTALAGASLFVVKENGTSLKLGTFQ